jgi:predicted transcriptional regulator of viral defense system
MRKRVQKESWMEKAAGKLDPTRPRIIPYKELNRLLRDLQEEGALKLGTSTVKFVEALEKAEVIQVVELSRVTDTEESKTSRARRLYIIGRPSAMTVAQSLRPRSYLSHGTAMLLHRLASADNNLIYVNQEQSPKQQLGGTLQQEAIDRAFSNSPRTSTYAFTYGGSTIVLLNGKQTNNYDVEELHEAGERLFVTSVARTLVDITVRPVYAGGVSKVFKAFQIALRNHSAQTLVQKVAKALNVVSHAYPYHQSIGFYFERAGLDPKLLSPFQPSAGAFDFYLDYKLANPAYDPKWKIYFPPDMEDRSAHTSTILQT